MENNPQEKLFVRIHDEYSSHYYDEISILYRKKFLYNLLFDNENLNHKNVAEIACGSGFNSLNIKYRFPLVKITGYDISPPACEDYKKIVGSEAYVWDLTKEKINNIKYDYVIVIGGLHHCIESLDVTLKNIFNMLKKNGTLIMFEPNKNYFLDVARRLWYKLDNYFDTETEDSLDHKKLLDSQRKSFSLKNICFLGGPAYFLIYNSLIFRFPLFFKRILSPILFFLEKLYNKIPLNFMFPAFVAKWKKI